MQDLHREEFTRYALTIAEHGLAATLTGLAPGSRYHEGVWEWPGAAPARDVRLDGRGLVLPPTFHHPAGPLLQDAPGRPAVMTYPSGPAEGSRPVRWSRPRCRSAEGRGGCSRSRARDPLRSA